MPAPWLAVLVPGVLAAAAGLAAPAVPWGDAATLQLATDRAARLSQLVGPYSRYGWSHPGPLLFYLAVLPYQALGRSAAAMAAAFALIATAAAVVLVVLVGRLAGRRAAVAAAALSAAFLAVLGPSLLTEVWNPAAVIVPLTVVLVAAAGLATGRWWALPWVVAAATFVAQSDVTTAPVAAVVSLAGLGVAVAQRSRGRTSAPARSVAAAIGVATVVAALLWLPAVIQQFAGPGPPNLSTMVTFLTSSHGPRHPVLDAIRYVGGGLWPPLRGRLSSSPPPTAASAAVLACALATAAGVALAARRRGAPLAFALAALSGVAIVVAVVAATLVVGPLFPYLTVYVAGAGAGVLLAAALVLFAGGDRPLGVPPAAVAATVMAAAAATGVALATLVAEPALPRPQWETAALWRGLERHLPPPGAGPVTVDVADHDRWPWAAGLFVELTHHGYRAQAEPAWLFLFGHVFAPAPGRPAATVTVTGSGHPLPAGPAVVVAGSTEAAVSPG